MASNPEDNIHDRLAHYGITHKNAALANPNIHNLYEAETGKLMTRMTAYEASQFLDWLDTAD